MVPGPARTLDEVIGVFDPRRPLEGDTLTAYYVERGSMLRRQMKDDLERGIRREPIKMLFTGHRGSGKSTELSKLIQDLDDRFFVVVINTADTVAPTDLTYVDVILIMAMALFKTAASEHWIDNAPAQILNDVWDDVGRMIDRVIFGNVPYHKKLAVDDVSLKLGASVVQSLSVEFQARFRDEVNTRESIRKEMQDRLSEVIRRVNLLSIEIEKRYHRPVLLVVEDTDKIEKERAEIIFFKHAQTLAGFNASVIYTFPIELRHSREFGDIKRYFQTHRMPNLVLFTRDGVENPAGRAVMEEVLTRRMDLGLAMPDARRAIIRCSGGLMRYVIELTNEAAYRAFARESDRIELQDAERVIAELRKDFTAALRNDDYPILFKRHADKRLSSDDQMQDLLRMRALLEYENGDVWCDVHPAILPLVEERVSDHTIQP